MPKSTSKDASKSTKSRDSVKEKLLQKKEGFLQADSLLGFGDISKTFKSLKGQYADVEAISSATDSEAFIAKVFKEVLSPFLLERLSVFAEHYPEIYQRHIFCGWLAGLVAREMGLSDEMVINSVGAALSRDIGLLYLPDTLLDENAKYGPSEWNAMKTHTLVGEIVCRDIGEINAEQSRAIVEHHERHDGLGYPRGLKGKSLSIISEIVGAVDTIGAIRFKRFEHSGRNLRDVYAYIQMNENQFNPKVNSALFSVLVKTGVERSTVNPFKTIDKLVSHLYVRAAAMNGVIHLMHKLNDALVFFEKGPKRKELQEVNQLVTKLINQSGVLDKEMLEWLNTMDNSYDYRKVNLAELSEMELMQNELYWHLKRVSDACQAFHDLEMNKRNPSCQVITTVLKCLNEKNLPRAAASIRKN